LSSDDNSQLVRSFSLTNQHWKKDCLQSKTSLDEINDINQQDESSNNILIPNIQSFQCTSSSKQSSRMASPALSTSSQSSGHMVTLLGHQVIQLPVYLEREILIKHNFEQLSKEN